MESRPPTIDMHVHYLPDVLAGHLRRRETAPCIKTMSDGTEHRVLPTGHTLPFSDRDTDMEARLAVMDEMEVERQMLSMGLIYGIHALPLEESVPLCRAFNDDLGALGRRHPDRYSGLALLPMADIDAAAGELRRARRELALVGAILPADGFASLADAELLRPIFDAAQELGGHIFIHPGRRADESAGDGGGHDDRPPIDNHRLRESSLNVQARLSEAMVTLLLTDFLVPYPDVSVQVANLGGSLPFILERMDNTAKLRLPDEPLPSDRMRRVYVDCASLGARAVELAVAVYGADRVVFGTDYPIFRADWAMDGIGAANISGGEARKILHENAAGLLERISKPVDGHKTKGIHPDDH